MRAFALFLLVTLALSTITQAYPMPEGHNGENNQHRERQRLVTRELPPIEKPISTYKAVTRAENKKVIALAAGVALSVLATLGMAGMRVTEHFACKAVETQETLMQSSWDEMHKDGFVAAGDGMRPATFDCKTQERGFKPLKSYAGAAEWY
ncbi:uncharacterized protein SPSC_04157 [Sporisorium scitamineum]|uniref:Uncharacterized protein n=1 Tax=Sporisorium scitamineum TaxID=49012 RepID=A0A0F7S728_9BASI|nr:uncharacterized protein SPSC_04157 [Sporisorium scitamineum]CDW97064.1 hypothetical protein [Sporisorium scitamineum]